MKELLKKVSPIEEEKYGTTSLKEYILKINPGFLESVAPKFDTANTYTKTNFCGGFSHTIDPELLEDEELCMKYFLSIAKYKLVEIEKHSRGEYVIIKMDMPSGGKNCDEYVGRIEFYIS